MPAEERDELLFGASALHHPVLMSVELSMFDGLSWFAMPAFRDEHSTTGQERGRHASEHVVDVCVRNVLEEEERRHRVVATRWDPAPQDVDLTERHVWCVDDSLLRQREHPLRSVQ